MHYLYARVSTTKQDLTNQEYAVMKFCQENNIVIDKIISEEISSKKSDRRVYELLDKCEGGDVIYVYALDRLGRSLRENINLVMSLLERKVKIYDVSRRQGITDDLNSKVTLTMYSLFAEMERTYIQERTKSALAAKKAQGMQLGRKPGSFSKHHPLDPMQNEIKTMLNKGVSITSIAKIVGKSRCAVEHYIKTRGLKK